MILTLLPYILAGVILVSAFLILRIAWEMKRRIVITVSRPTTADGEQVGLTTTVPGSLSPRDVSEALEKLVLAVEARLVNRNELVARTNAEVSHQKWLRIKAKIEEAEKEHRTGPGVLTKEERNWWAKFGSHFDKDGPVGVVDLEKAAHTP